MSAGFDVAAVLFCVRALLRGVADATCVGLAFALAAFGFAVAIGVVAVLPLAVPDELLSMDVLPTALVDVLPLIDVDGVLVLADALVPALAVLFLRHSLNAAPSLPMHGADETEEAGGGVVAVLVADGVYVDCAPTTPAAASAVASSRARGLNRDWFIKTSYR